MKYRIYVIEDDENIRNLICVALENFGYCASGFETAEEALDSLSALLRRGREAQREYPAMFVFDLDAAGDGRHGGDPQDPGDAGLFRSPGPDADGKGS